MHALLTVEVPGVARVRERRQAPRGRDGDLADDLADVSRQNSKGEAIQRCRSASLTRPDLRRGLAIWHALCFRMVEIKLRRPAR